MTTPRAALEALAQDPTHEAVLRRVIEDPKWAAKQDVRFWVAHVARMLDSIDAARAALAEAPAEAERCAECGNERAFWEHDFGTYSDIPNGHPFQPTPLAPAPAPTAEALRERERIRAALFDNVDEWAVGGVWGDYGQVVFRADDVAEVVFDKPTDTSVRLGSEWAATNRDLRMTVERLEDAASQPSHGDAEEMRDALLAEHVAGGPMTEAYLNERLTEMIAAARQPWTVEALVEAMRDIARLPGHLQPRDWSGAALNGWDDAVEKIPSILAWLEADRG